MLHTYYTHSYKLYTMYIDTYMISSLQRINAKKFFRSLIVQSATAFIYEFKAFHLYIRQGIRTHLK